MIWTTALLNYDIEVIIDDMASPDYKEITLRLEDLCKNPDAPIGIKLNEEALSRITADNQDEVIDLLSNVLLMQVGACHTADSLEKTGRLVEAVSELRHVEGLHDSFAPLDRTISEHALRAALFRQLAAGHYRQTKTTQD